MDAETFRRQGYAIVDWIAEYWRRVEGLPVQAQSEPGEIYDALAEHPPTEGESIATMLRDFDELVMPGITHWQSPNFFGYFPANTSGASVLGDLLSSGLGVQGMLWATSPACTEVEMKVLDWMIELLDLPRSFHSTSAGGGVIQDTASSATLCALLAARERATGYASNKIGVMRRLRVYASPEAHSSIEKDVRIAGIGDENLVRIDTDDTLAMRVDALRAAIASDREAGCTPCMVLGTVGTTSTNAMDPVRAIAEVCKEHDLWLHVDAAMSGSAAVCPEFRWIHDGLELADSYCFNPHKWLLTNFDCDCFYVADRNALIRTLTIMPEYLRNAATDEGAVIDYRDWQIPLGRRFRALKLWFTVRHYGVNGLQQHIRLGVELAQRFARWIEADDRFELAAVAPLNLVCFRHVDGEEKNRQLLDALNNSGRMFLTHTRVNDQLTLRLCVGATRTQERHVEAAWSLIQKTAAEL